MNENGDVREALAARGWIVTTEELPGFMETEDGLLRKRDGIAKAESYKFGSRVEQVASSLDRLAEIIDAYEAHRAARGQLGAPTPVRVGQVAAEPSAPAPAPPKVAATSDEVAA